MDPARILIEHSYNLNQLNIAFSIVRDYLVGKDRILYGGIAIDFTLKNVGKSIYKDYVLPDYDFYSDDFIGDALNIANLLHDAGITDVDFIHAKHLSTLRVRVATEVVADITHRAKDIYDHISADAAFYKEYKITPIHLLVFNLLITSGLNILRNPPNESIFRFKKDIDRFKEINDIYLNSINSKYDVAMQELSKSIPQVSLAPDHLQFDGCLLCGEVLALLILHKYREFAGASMIDDLIEIDGKNIKYKLVEPLSFYMYDKNLSTAGIESATKKELLHSETEDIPSRYHLDYDGSPSIDVYMFHDCPLQYNIMKVDDASVKHVSMSLLLHYMMYKISFTKSKDTKAYYSYLYYHLNQLISAFEKLDSSNPSMELYKKVPCFISSNVIGNYKEDTISTLMYDDKYRRELTKAPNEIMRIPRYDPAMTTKDEYMEKIKMPAVQRLLDIL
jgi:hypothetical protein